MVPTLEELQADLQRSLKSGDRLRVSTIRLLLSDIKYTSVAKGAPLSEDDLVEVVKRQIKRRDEAIELFEKGGRADLASKEAAEREVLADFLPPQLSEEEVARIVSEAVSSAGASGPRDKGKVMGLVMPRVKGKADGKLVSRLVDEALSR